MNEPNQTQGAPSAQGTPVQPQASVTGATANFASQYFSSQWSKDIAEFQSFNARKTGYSNMDAVQPLYPGFYVIGAISSLGKTTFIHQMCDQIATDGNPVLYFSLEQSKFEMFSKSISRKTYIQSKSDPTYRPFSSIDIRRGAANCSRELSEQTQSYVNDVTDKMIIVECNFSSTVEEIIDTIVNYINTFKVTPIVVIDYLQIITPSIVNQRMLADKASIDYIIHKLKSFQSHNNLTLITICSLNRQNYMLPIDFESFKESGGIEYTADVVWGLQLSAIHDEIFSKQNNLKEKREKILEAKNQIPREIELVTLKNRYGRASWSVGFTYHPVYDYFEPIVDEEYEQTSIDDDFSSLTGINVGANPFQ